ncbi:stage II sporulation protein D [Virgibacillus siamensis]|uniref:stage II sporulation protein D n=1 Tax=Virgibacillus siamensis TaxID=480071 RepID=UPI0009874953|nr:stage II sporulation protein D [Virgibacillus siamensis]
MKQPNIPGKWKKKKKKHSNLLPFQKSSKFNNQRAAPWRLQGIIFFATLITIILIIPTLIVVPFVGDSDQHTADEKKDGKVDISMGDSPFSVAVMRANADKVENVPLETYVARVVASEMPGEFEIEALKAQALAARTFIVNHMISQDQSGKSDVTDTVSDQVYHSKQELRDLLEEDFEWKMEKIKKAVKATKGEILTYDDAPITASFFSTSNGYTENSEDYWSNKVPYLRSVKSPWDKKSPKFLAQEIFTVPKVEEALGVKLPNSGDIDMEITRTEGKRVDKLKIAGQKFSGRKIREKLELASSDFTIEQKNDHLIFTTQGFGHGIGMSQYGANGMAKHGKTYKQIVKHYYKGVEISSINKTAPTLVAK